MRRRGRIGETVNHTDSNGVNWSVVDIPGSTPPAVFATVDPHSPRKYDPQPPDTDGGSVTKVFAEIRRIAAANKKNLVLTVTSAPDKPFPWLIVIGVLWLLRKR